MKKGEELYKSSIEILKQVQMENGGCLATPPGQRYPYVYPRDHAVCILGFLSAGMYKNARKGIEFTLKAQLENGAFPQRYDKNGKDASYKPIQLDGSGLILYALSKYVQKTKDFELVEKYWDKINKAIDYIQKNLKEEKNLVYTPNAIHEFPPIENGLEIYTNSVVCGGLKEMAEVAKMLEYNNHQFINGQRSNWVGLYKTIYGGINTYMWNSRLNSFIKTIRLNESSSIDEDPDASTLALSEYEVLKDSDEKMKKNVERLKKELWHKKLGGLCRYPKYIGRNNGGWGPWPHFTLMLAKHYLRSGNIKEAEKCIKWVIDNSFENKIPEHLATKEDFEEYYHDYMEAGVLRPDRVIMLENAKKHPLFKKGIVHVIEPLAWPHAEFIMTWNLYKETLERQKRKGKIVSIF